MKVNFFISISLLQFGAGDSAAVPDVGMENNRLGYRFKSIGMPVLEREYSLIAMPITIGKGYTAGKPQP
jgi:hypothetical protein